MKPENTKTLAIAVTGVAIIAAIFAEKQGRIHALTQQAQNYLINGIDNSLPVTSNFASKWDTTISILGSKYTDYANASASPFAADDATASSQHEEGFDARQPAAKPAGSGGGVPLVPVTAIAPPFGGALPYVVPPFGGPLDIAMRGGRSAHE